MEVISGDGELKELDLEGFNNSAEYDLSYSVGIIGPQGSGKSTLLNHLCGTSFPQRDPSITRWKGMATTKGVWIAEAQKEPFTLVMDLEGTDGKERGQDGTAFEKRSALFALAVAHTLLINMWYHDFGREHASNRPLLRTIFESVITMPMFSCPPRKTTLLFVVRDMSSYDESLETPIKEDVQKIWEEVRKPEGRELTPLSDFFNVEYFPMSSYREKRETFDVGCSGGSPSHLNSSLTEWLNCTASSSPWFVSSQPHKVAAPCRSSSSLMLLHRSCPVAVVTGDAAAARRRRSSDSWSFVHAATPFSLAQTNLSANSQIYLRAFNPEPTPDRISNPPPFLRTLPLLRRSLRHSRPLPPSAAVVAAPLRNPPLSLRNPRPSVHPLRSAAAIFAAAASRTGRTPSLPRQACCATSSAAAVPPRQIVPPTVVPRRIIRIELGACLLDLRKDPHRTLRTLRRS